MSDFVAHGMCTGLACGGCVLRNTQGPPWSAALPWANHFLLAIVEFGFLYNLFFILISTQILIEKNVIY